MVTVTVESQDVRNYWDEENNAPAVPSGADFEIVSREPMGNLRRGTFYRQIRNGFVNEEDGEDTYLFNEDPNILNLVRDLRVRVYNGIAITLA